MSKKFGVNSKSAEAKTRKDAVKQTNERDKQQKLEDEYWRDDDKNLQKKNQRKVRRHGFPLVILSSDEIRFRMNKKRRKTKNFNGN